MFESPQRHLSHADLLAEVKVVPEMGGWAIIILFPLLGLLMLTGVISPNMNIPLAERAPGWLPWLFVAVGVAMVLYCVVRTILEVRKALREENHQLYVDELNIHSGKLEGELMKQIDYLVDEFFRHPDPLNAEWKELKHNANALRTTMCGLHIAGAYAPHFEEIIRWKTRTDARRLYLRKTLDREVTRLCEEAGTLRSEISAFYNRLKALITVDQKARITEVPRRGGGVEVLS